MEREKFLKTAKEVFGDRVVIEQLKINDEDAKRLRVNLEDVQAYPPQAWVVTRDGHCRCPNCDHPLGGLLGSFKWGLMHGVGFCSRCREVQFRYYHYVTERKEEDQFATAAYIAEHGQKRRIELFAVYGFSEKLVEERDGQPHRKVDTNSQGP